MFRKTKALIVVANQKDHLSASSVIFLVSFFLYLIKSGHTHFLIAKFVVSRCVFANFECFFCSVNHLNGGGVNANHHSPSLACKNKIDNDPKLVKNSEGNRDDEWNFC